MERLRHPPVIDRQQCFPFWAPSYSHAFKQPYARVTTCMSLVLAVGEKRDDGESPYHHKHGHSVLPKLTLTFLRVPPWSACAHDLGLSVTVLMAHSPLPLGTSVSACSARFLLPLRCNGYPPASAEPAGRTSLVPCTQRCASKEEPPKPKL